MALLDDLLATLPDGEVSQVIIGLHWTAVVTTTGNSMRCGLASTLTIDHDHHKDPDVPNAGQLDLADGLVLATFAQSDSPIMRGVGVAAMNSLLFLDGLQLAEENAEQVIAEQGKGKQVVVVGRFPFVHRLNSQGVNVSVLEINPLPGEMPASSASEVIPSADVVAITGMSLVNGTLESLLGLCSPRSFVILLGPSAPLSPVLFDYGVDMICGAVVADISPVLKAVRQGANFHQIHQAGVRLVSLARDA